MGTETREATMKTSLEAPQKTKSRTILLLNYTTSGYLSGGH